MSVLHTVNKSPFERNGLESCLRYVKKGSSVLLIEDGVFGALAGSTTSTAVKGAMANVAVYALEADVLARGIKGKLLDGVKLVDYAGFVDLVTQHDTTSAWL
ncbi:MAG: sulfurtransferase complex subunit TusB [Pseudomonadota bacterium]